MNINMISYNEMKEELQNLKNILKEKKLSKVSIHKISENISPAEQLSLNVLQKKRIILLTQLVLQKKNTFFCKNYNLRFVFRYLWIRIFILFFLKIFTFM